jgi:hypothetical protein
MTSDHDIRYLRRKDLDTLKWDRCIDTAHNGLLYAHSFYLDHMTAGQWDALVLGDYQTVMPLTWRRKWGITYLYQPAFTQQLGIFSAAPLPSAAPHSPAVAPAAPPALSRNLVDSFLAHIPRHFRFAEIFLNHDNPRPDLKPRANFILDLNVKYDELAGRYKKGLDTSLQTAARTPLTYLSDFDLPAALELNRRTQKNNTPHVKGGDHRRFTELCIFLGGRGQTLVRAVADERQEPLAIVLFLRDKRRIYLLQATTMPAGRKIGANHFLLDSVIREFAGQPLILDFEGSDIPGIAHFYKSFGSTDQPYFFYRHNHLPWPLRLLK